jgi:uncharacterized protein YlxW (UPF0749 family)
MTFPRADSGTATRMPSLLGSLLSNHLDPGYAAAAAERRRAGDPGRPAARRGWQAVAALLIAAVFAAAVAQARSTAPGVTAAQQALAASVTADQARIDQLTATRNALAAQSDDVARRELTADATGRALLAGLDAAALSAATTAVSGPGLMITVTDPGVGPDLSDVSKQRVAGREQVILDRDLQLVVNALWAAGAEAIAVGGVRIGPDVTIRQAGGAILVDNQPIAGPYVVLAIGAPETMRDSFEASSALQRLRLLETAYRAGVTVSTEDELSVPAGGAREVRFAERAGP